MTRYKGYYIDGVIFRTKQEIDDFIKNEIIRKIKIFYELFSSDRYSPAEKMSICKEISTREIRLHDEYGMEWDEIEALQFE